MVFVNMKLLLVVCFFWNLLQCDAAEVTTLETPGSSNSTKQGYCPKYLNSEESDCSNSDQHCELDSDCEDEFKCCAKECGNVCTYPKFTGCQQVFSLLKHQQQHSSGERSFLPKCKKDGSFEDVQCDEVSQKCWCVDDLGFELAGTRENSFDLVNCSAPKPCAGVLCRMLCPYGFELDFDGCPICRCRNPCQGVECPAGQECQLEEIPCAEDVCPPLPTCKQPRRLEDLCPMGVPLSSPDSGNPFLCGVEPNKPQCPPNYLCDVMPGNDYGVCCPLVDKPGQCPAELHPGEQCHSCSGDMDCTGVHKCCEIKGCGMTCTKPANTTLCLQQKAVVELLLGTNEYEGYVPQCLEDGEFSPKQCSSNGHLCWCVITNGTIIPGTMGPSSGVKCTQEKAEVLQEIEGRTEAETKYVFECEKWECDLKCEAGYKYDGKGCKICKCSEPCKDITCPDGMECMLIKMDNCFDDDCVPIATCRDTAVQCNWGRALHSNNTGAVILCPESSCPDTHTCEMKQRNGICCPKRVEIEHTKDSECPDYVYEPQQCHAVCSSDAHCQGDMKCCPSKQCGAICVPPKPPKMPTMCEYIRDAGQDVQADIGNATLAIPLPQCLPDGPYNPKQCDLNGECFCVDEFGVEIIKTRTSSPFLDCVKVRDEMTCLGLICRLGCDFGFIMDDEGCPLCSCRNPCQNVSCGFGRTCQFLDVDCKDDWCPPLPYCVPMESSARTFPECPVGSPLLYEYDNEPIACDPFSAYSECPSSHNCVVTNPREMGVCCPLADEETDDDLVIKAGQCPYLIPIQSESCEYLCNLDEACEGKQKCCSNGCGTQCVEPVLKTGCEHQKSAAEHRAIELSIPASHIFIPNCTEEGEFAAVQCDPVDGICWCVDQSGSEIAGTRRSAKEKNNCVPAKENCTSFDCDAYCSHGFEIDANGCQMCKCKDPCQDIKCKNSQETCRPVSVNCVSQPCPLVPLCLPRIENPCPIGEPLSDGQFGDVVQCGPEGEQCPSSHRCHLSPLGEYAVCCPNPIVSSCEQMKKRNLQLRKSANRITFLPKCNRKTGAWDPTQCMESLGLCWCVDSEGNQLPGSLIRGVPHCTARAGKSLQNTPICTNGLPVHLCSEDLCAGKICLAQPNATCNIDPCGGCKVQFLDDFNRVVDCTNGLTACFAEVQKIINTGVLKPSDLLEDDILPALEDLVDEMMVPPPVYPPPPPPPQFARLKRREASYDYDYDFDYENSPSAVSFNYEHPNMRMKELHSTSPSVMMPKVERVYIEAPRMMPTVLNRMPSFLDMMPMQGLLDSMGAEPQIEIIGMSQRFTIIDDGESSVMVKPGACPVPSLLSLLRSISQGCKDRCLTDFDCPASLKCCLYSCGMGCVPAVLVPAPRRSSRRPGECPRDEVEATNPFACLFMRDMCSEDRDCSKNRKCCPTACGHQCVKAAKKKTAVDVRPVFLKAAAPKCSVEGGYSITQKQGDLSWCVDRYGNPLHNTLTRGTVECNSNGTIISRTETGPVCSDPRKMARICKEECLEADCPVHPDAVCLADPCNNCAVRFVSADGFPVSCEGTCKQHLVIGNCRSSLPRFYFNQIKGKCEPFVYGGCGGNDNNFQTLESCREECEKEVQLCELPKDNGLCRAQIFRWYYNKNTHRCEQFIYGGCGGNRNNFETRESCEQRCPDVVLCPWINVNGDDLTPCRRSAVCANATCPGKPEAVCSVDPCSCEAQFVDKHGLPVTCLNKDTEQEESAASLRTAALSMHTRCQSLMKRHLLNADATYIPQCDEDGQFYPTQCSREKPLQCWCVDEAGMQLRGTSPFAKGIKSCSLVKIQKVEVTLAFTHDDADYSELMKPAIKRLIEQFLDDLKAKTTPVVISILPETTQIMFTLLGDNKVQTAFQLNEMMRMENIFIVLPKAELSVNYKDSHFYYENEVVDNNIASSHVNDLLISGNDYNWALFTVFIGLGCILLFLVFYVIPAIIRKRSNGKDDVFDENEKPSLISMVFHNVTYGITGRKSTKKPPISKEEPPKVVVQTVEAQYEDLQKAAEDKSDQQSVSSEAPPAYDDIKDNTSEKLDKH